MSVSIHRAAQGDNLSIILNKPTLSLPQRQFLRTLTLRMISTSSYRTRFLELLSLFKSPKLSPPDCLVPLLPDLPQQTLFYLRDGTLTDQDNYTNIMFIRKDRMG